MKSLIVAAIAGAVSGLMLYYAGISYSLLIACAFAAQFIGGYIVGKLSASRGENDSM